MGLLWLLRHVFHHEVSFTHLFSASKIQRNCSTWLQLEIGSLSFQKPTPSRNKNPETHVLGSNWIVNIRIYTYHTHVLASALPSTMSSFARHFLLGGKMVGRRSVPFLFVFGLQGLSLEMRTPSFRVPGTGWVNPISMNQPTNCHGFVVARTSTTPQRVPTVSQRRLKHQLLRDHRIIHHFLRNLWDLKFGRYPGSPKDYCLNVFFRKDYRY